MDYWVDRKVECRNGHCTNPDSDAIHASIVTLWTGQLFSLDTAKSLFSCLLRRESGIKQLAEKHIAPIRNYGINPKLRDVAAQLNVSLSTRTL